MSKKIIEARVIQKVGTAQEWSNDDFVLMDGEMGFERTSTGLPVNFKVGDNDKRYSELPYFHPYIINGSISTTQTISELNALSNGVYSAKGAGTYANGLTANEGQYTTFRKDDDGWHLDARVDVTWENADLTAIQNELDDHEQRITTNENNIQYLTDYTWGKAQALTNLTNKVNNLQDTDVKIGISNGYPELYNPTTQNSFNRRIFNYVKNGLASSSNFKTNTYNNVTNQFGFGSSSFVFSQEVDGTPYISTGGVKTAFGVDYLRHGSSEDNYTELSVGYISGKANGVTWNIAKDDSQTQESNIQLPITGNTFRTAIISVNGQFADENGDIEVDLDFIPLTGTEEGKPITGTLKVDESVDTLLQAGEYEVEPSAENPIGRGTVGSLVMNKKYFGYGSISLTDTEFQTASFNVGVNPLSGIPTVTSMYHDLGVNAKMGYQFTYHQGVRSLILNADFINVDTDFKDYESENKTILAQRSYVDAMQTKPTNWSNSSQRMSALADKSVDATYNLFMGMDANGNIAKFENAYNMLYKSFSTMSQTEVEALRELLRDLGLVGAKVVTDSFNPPTLAELSALNLRAGDFYHCSANGQRSLFDGNQLVSWNCTQAEYNVLTTDKKNAVKLINIVIE